MLQSSLLRRSCHLENGVATSGSEPIVLKNSPASFAGNYRIVIRWLTQRYLSKGFAA